MTALPAIPVPRQLSRVVTTTQLVEAHRAGVIGHVLGSEAAPNMANVSDKCANLVLGVHDDQASTHDDLEAITGES